MTTHYVDIKVVPDSETSAEQLLGALHDRLHLVLVHQHQESIGVSFPGYSLIPRTLGQVLRLHGTDADLHRLLAADWLKGVRDHVRVSAVATVPVGAQHRMVQRKQFKTSAERLRRRRMRRKGETKEQAAIAIPSSVERAPNIPYLRVHSRSTGQPFCLFISLGPLSANASLGCFSSYGFGRTATVPWF